MDFSFLARTVRLILQITAKRNAARLCRTSLNVSLYDLHSLFLEQDMFIVDYLAFS